MSVLERLLALITRTRGEPGRRLTPSSEIVQQAEHAAEHPERAEPEDVERMQEEITARLHILRARMAKERNGGNGEFRSPAA